MKYLFMVGMALVIFGICFLVTFRKEKTKRYIVVQGKVIEVVKSLGVRNGFTYTLSLNINTIIKHLELNTEFHRLHLIAHIRLMMLWN